MANKNDKILDTKEIKTAPKYLLPLSDGQKQSPNTKEN